MTWLRRTGLAVVGTVVVGLAVLGFLAIAYSPAYVLRWMVWQEADVDDYQRFPSRQIQAAPEPFTFSEPADPVAAATWVQDRLTSGGNAEGDLDGFLESTGTQAFIVIRDDEFLYERYFGDFERDSIATSFSVAKSYVSALVGIAIDQDAIGSADDPITDYLPELLERDARFADITIRHLLDMRSGIRYQESSLPSGDDTLTYYFDDLRQLALERTEIEESPGGAWHYVNYNPLLLGLILERATGRPVAKYLSDELWTRIGTEFEASWSLDSEGGFEKMESGINARPIDFAKFGRLYAQDGLWDGDQIVPSAWVETTTLPEEFAGYPPRFDRPFGTISHTGYWWQISLSDGGHAFTAVGNHGQFVFVAPETQVVAVRFGERYGIGSFEWLELFTTLATE